LGHQSRLCDKFLPRKILRTNSQHELGREIECKPDLSPQGVIAVRDGSVVIAAAIGASAATKNVVQRAGRPSDSGSDRGASADIRMRASGNAGTCCSA